MEIGNKWSAIARGLVNRNQHNVKNRWNFLTKTEQGDQVNTNAQELVQSAIAPIFPAWPVTTANQFMAAPFLTLP